MGNNNYATIKGMWERETDPAKKARLRETLDCMEEAAANRSIRPDAWQQTNQGKKP
jgi:hypothetical protein